MTNDSVVLTHALTKTYGDAQAVRGLDLSVKQNQITAFLGRNGAGKSTTIKMLLGMVRATSGEAFVLGRRITNPEENCLARRQVAFVAENKPLYDYMTVEQTIRFTRSFYPDWRSDVERTLLRDYELPLRRKVSRLSKGMRTKLALLLAFSRRPELLILDEPSEGLDPVGSEYLLQTLVAQSADGVTVFFSSHQIAEVERIADQVCVLEKGRLLLDASMDELRQLWRRIDLVFAKPPAESELHISGVESIRISGRQVSLFVSRNADAVVERARSLQAVSIDVAPVGLREIFLETVKED
jgi:ABC-2 type transport system ATP-binding protein